MLVREKISLLPCIIILLQKKKVYYFEHIRIEKQYIKEQINYGSFFPPKDDLNKAHFCSF